MEQQFVYANGAWAPTGVVAETMPLDGITSVTACDVVIEGFLRRIWVAITDVTFSFAVNQPKEGVFGWSVLPNAEPDTSNIGASHPEWANVLLSHAFKDWLSEQPDSYQKLIRDTADQSVIIEALSQFNAAANSAPEVDLSDPDEIIPAWGRLIPADDLIVKLEQTQAALALAIAERDAAKRALAAAQAESEQQQQGALLYLTAVVGRAVAHGSTMTMSRADMEEAMSLVLERGDPLDGGLALRVYKVAPPVEPEPSLILPLAPVLAKVERPIILLDTSRPKGE